MEVLEGGVCVVEMEGGGCVCAKIDCNYVRSRTKARIGLGQGVDINAINCFESNFLTHGLVLPLTPGCTTECISPPGCQSIWFRD